MLSKNERQLCYLCSLLGKDTRIIATGGASNNPAILQVLADVFNAPVYTFVSNILLWKDF
jgi:Sugar (pentulose and hexulose) kinases